MLRLALSLTGLLLVQACEAQPPKATPSPPLSPEMSAPAPGSATATATATASAPASSSVPTMVRKYLWLAAKSKRAPLVMFLHGYGSTPVQAVNALELGRVAKALDVHIAVPEGTLDEAELRFWHASDACCDFDRTGIDDVAALRGVLEDVKRRHDVSGRHVVGFSNGAFMAHRLACDASDLLDGFAAFAGVGVVDGSRCKPTRPLRMLQIHGTADRAVRYEGGRVLGRTDVARHPGAVATTRFWAEHNDCSKTTELPPPHAISGLPTIAVRHSACKERSLTALWTVTGGGHFVGIDRKTIEAAIRFLLAKS